MQHLHAATLACRLTGTSRAKRSITKPSSGLGEQEVELDPSLLLGASLRVLGVYVVPDQ